jgi:hypothetical protein
MTLPVSSYEELLARVRSLTHETIQLQRELTTPLIDHNENGEYWSGSSGHSPPTTRHFRFFSVTSFTETADSSAFAGKAVSSNLVFGHELENSVFPQLKNVLTLSSIVTAHLHTCTLKYIYVHTQCVAVGARTVHVWASRRRHCGTAITAEGLIVR